MDNQQRLDLLSDLPVGIIHMILSLVPFKEAVRTSLLSKQWRFTWVSLPYLKFDEDDDRLPGQTDSEFAESENKVISHALRRHKGPIHRFQMSFLEEIYLPNLNEWIPFLSRNDIRELVILGIEFNMDESIYNCSKLTRLEVYTAKFGPPPSTFKGFPFLRCLTLQCSYISDEVKSLLVNSPLLERLTLDLYYGRSKLRSNLPYLKYLRLQGWWDEIHLCAPLLTELIADIFGYDEFACMPPHHDVCNYTNLFGGCSNLQKLHASNYFIKYLSFRIESCNHTLMFPHLKDIVLYDLCFGDIKEMSVVARLLNGAPNLQKLDLSGESISPFSQDGSRAQNLSFKDFGFAPNFTFQKLRVVTVSDTRCRQSGVELVKFLLKSSPVLETMNLSLLTDLHYKNVTAELLAFRRASPNAQILFS